jgi:hypothetical protein
MWILYIEFTFAVLRKSALDKEPIRKMQNGISGLSH